MFDDEPVAAPSPGPRNLEPLSVADLEAYIAELQAEITRAREAIAAKQRQRAGADALFGGGATPSA